MTPTHSRLCNQPSPEMEELNAAYVWAKECLKNHAARAAGARDYIDPKDWGEITWTFERAKIAYERFFALEAARKEAKK